MGSEGRNFTRICVKLQKKNVIFKIFVILQSFSHFFIGNIFTIGFEKRYKGVGVRYWCYN
jgi:hypothetical protein